MCGRGWDCDGGWCDRERVKGVGGGGGEEGEEGEEGEGGEAGGWCVDQWSLALPTTLWRDSMMSRLLGVKVALLMAATSGSGPPSCRPTTLSRICRSLRAAPGDTLWGSAPEAPPPPPPPPPPMSLAAVTGELPSLLTPPVGANTSPPDLERSRDMLRPFWRGHV